MILVGFGPFHAQKLARCMRNTDAIHEAIVLLVHFVHICFLSVVKAMSLIVFSPLFSYNSSVAVNGKRSIHAARRFGQNSFGCPPSSNIGIDTSLGQCHCIFVGPMYIHHLSIEQHLASSSTCCNNGGAIVPSGSTLTIIS